MSLAKENAGSLATLEAQVARLTSKSPAPSPEQNVVKVSQTYWGNLDGLQRTARRSPDLRAVSEEGAGRGRLCRAR